MKIPTFCLISLLLLVLLGLSSSHSHHSEFNKREVKELKTLLKYVKTITNAVKDTFFEQEAETNANENFTLASDDNSKARLFISGLLDSSMKGNWNKTFLNSVNATNFKYKEVIKSFDLLAQVITFNGTSTYDLNKIYNATIIILEVLNNLVNNIFPVQNNRRSVPAPYQTIYKQLVYKMTQYNYTTFLDNLHCLEQAQYDLHSAFLEMKWWSRKDLHKSGLVWGIFDLNMYNCTTNELFLLSFDISTHYYDCQKFFFGLVTARLGKNWSTDLTNLVSDENFDHLSILNALSLIAKNVDNRDVIVWNTAVKNVSEIINNVIQALFPNETIPSGYANTYDFLNNTRWLYSDPAQFGKFVDIAKVSMDVADYIDNKIIASVKRDYSSAGYLWERLDEKLAQETIFDSEVYDRKNFSEENSDLKAKLLLSGFLDQTMKGDWNKTFLNQVNASNFPFDGIVKTLKALSNVDFKNSSQADRDLIMNATNHVFLAFSNLINSTFPLLHNQRKISTKYANIYKQLIVSLKNYDFPTFLNRTKSLSVKNYDFHSIFLEMGWLEARDMHRVGLVWGKFDQNLTLPKYKSHILTEEDEMASKFFFGLTASKLGKNWNRTIATNVTNDPFDYQSILYYLQMISDNVYDRCYLEWYDAVYSIYYILDDTINDLFPGQVPEKFSNVYEHLNNIRELYSDLDNFTNFVDNAKNQVNLSEFLTEKVMKSMSRDNSSSGYLWGMFNQIIQNVSVNDSCPKTNSSKTDKKAKSFLFGLMDPVFKSNWNHSILARVNATNLNVYEILFELETIERNLNNASTIRNCLYNISYQLNVLLNDLFPLVGYGYRYGIELRAIPSEYQNLFEELNRTIALYSHFRQLENVFEDEKSMEIVKNVLKKIRKTENFQEKGMIFGKFNRFVEEEKKRQIEDRDVEMKMIHNFLGLN